MIGLAGSAATNILTVRVITALGSDPSAEDPLLAVFNDGGLPVSCTQAAPLALSLAAGSTMGVPANTPFNLWVGWFYDAGVSRLALINTRNGSSVCSISAARASALAEGGGAADEAQKFFASAAISDKPFIVVGKLEWDAGLTTAGQWTTPSRVIAYYPGMKLPCDVVQVATTSTATQANNASSTYADAGPSVSLAPQSAANLVTLLATGPIGIVATAAGRRASARISRGGTVIGKTAQFYAAAAGTVILPANMMALDAPGTRSSCTWGVQIASSGGDLVTWANSGFDGASGASISAAEIAV